MASSSSSSPAETKAARRPEKQIKRKREAEQDSENQPLCDLVMYPCSGVIAAEGAAQPHNECLIGHIMEFPEFKSYVKGKTKKVEHVVVRSGRVLPIAIGAKTILDDLEIAEVIRYLSSNDMFSESDLMLAREVDNPARTSTFIRLLRRHSVETTKTKAAAKFVFNEKIDPKNYYEVQTFLVGWKVEQDRLKHPMDWTPSYPGNPFYQTRRALQKQLNDSKCGIETHGVRHRSECQFYLFLLSNNNKCLLTADCNVTVLAPLICPDLLEHSWREQMIKTVRQFVSTIDTDHLRGDPSSLLKIVVPCNAIVEESAPEHNPEEAKVNGTLVEDGQPGSDNDAGETNEPPEPESEKPRKGKGRAKGKGKGKGKGKSPGRPKGTGKGKGKGKGRKSAKTEASDTESEVEEPAESNLEPDSDSEKPSSTPKAASSRRGKKKRASTAAPEPNEPEVDEDQAVVMPSRAVDGPSEAHKELIETFAEDARQDFKKGNAVSIPSAIFGAAKLAAFATEMGGPFFNSKTLEVQSLVAALNSFHRTCEATVTMQGLKSTDELSHATIQHIWSTVGRKFLSRDPNEELFENIAVIICGVVALLQPKELGLPETPVGRKLATTYLQRLKTFYVSSKDAETKEPVVKAATKHQLHETTLKGAVDNLYHQETGADAKEPAAKAATGMSEAGQQLQRALILDGIDQQEAVLQKEISNPVALGNVVTVRPVSKKDEEPAEPPKKKQRIADAPKAAPTAEAEDVMMSPMPGAVSEVKVTAAEIADASKNGIPLSTIQAAAKSEPARAKLNALSEALFRQEVQGEIIAVKRAPPSPSIKPTAITLAPPRATIFAPGSPRKPPGSQVKPTTAPPLDQQPPRNQINPTTATVSDQQPPRSAGSVDHGESSVPIATVERVSSAVHPIVPLSETNGTAMPGGDEYEDADSSAAMSDTSDGQHTAPALVTSASQADEGY